MASFDPAPVLARFAGQKDRTTAKALGVDIATVRAWRYGRRRIRPGAADRIAIASGAHPGELWPEWWGTGT